VDPVQWFTSELLDRDTGLGVEFISVRLGETPDVYAIARDLELQDVSRVSTDEGELDAVSLHDAVRAVILGDAQQSGLFSPDELLDASELFRDYVLREPVVPVRSSPLSLAALAALAGKAGAGVAIGFATGGPTPLLMITVPAGIVFVLVATGAGRGLSDGLRYRIRRWFGVPDDWKPD